MPTSISDEGLANLSEFILSASGCGGARGRLVLPCDRRRSTYRFLLLRVTDIDEFDFLLTMWCTGRPLFISSGPS